MLIRVLIAGVAGGVLVFIMGALCHAGLQLQSRAIVNLPNEVAFTEAVKSQNLKAGLYGFPGMPNPAEGQDEAAAYAQTNERYKVGPSGLVLIAPTGEDMMGPKTLLMEWATNTLAALLVAYVVSLAGPEVGFGRRWFAVLLIGAISWLSLSASYGIWYRFPHMFVHDELFCALLEWGVAGLAIAAIVKRPPVIAPSK
jgi:hypothetical protein